VQRRTDDLTLLGIHSTKYELFLFCTFSICSSTSFDDMRPLNSALAVRYRPCRGSAAHLRATYSPRQHEFLVSSTIQYFEAGLQWSTSSEQRRAPDTGTAKLLTL
jgi:hypothetical protein